VDGNKLEDGKENADVNDLRGNGSVSRIATVGRILVFRIYRNKNTDNVIIKHIIRKLNTQPNE